MYIRIYFTYSRIPKTDTEKTPINRFYFVDNLFQLNFIFKYF